MKYTFFLLLFYSFCVGQDVDYQSLIIPDKYRENANSCIRDYTKKIIIKDQDEMVVKQHKVVTLFNEKGKEDAGMALFYDDDIRVKNLEVIVYNALGKEIEKIKKRDFRDISASGGSTMYTDSRFYVLDYEPRNYPVTYVLTSEISNSNTAFIDPWQPLAQNYQSVIKSEYEIIDEEGLGLRYEKSNFDQFDKVKLEKTPVGIKCTAKELMAIKNEQYSPGLKKFTPFFKVALSKFELSGVKGSASSWRQLGKWQFDNLIEGRDNISLETQKKIKALVAGIEDPVERAKKVYQYVQDKTRYISIQVGIGGWQPVEASEVDEVGYGDCKALTNYTKALLKVADVPAHYAVVYAGNTKKDIDPDFPSMQGNHVILNLPQEDKQDIWLECTSQKTPFGFIGDFTDDRKVLLIKKDGGEVVKTPTYDEKDNYQKIDAQLELDENGNLSTDFSITSKGTQFDEKYLLEYQPKPRVLKYYRNYYSHLKNIKIKSFTFQRDDEKVVFKEKLKISSINYGQKFGNRLMFIPNALNQAFSVPDKYENRVAPFTISRGFYHEDELVFTTPESLKVESMPEDIHLKTKFGEYTAEFKKKESNKIGYKRSLLIKKGNYKKEAYQDFREFVKQIRNEDQSKIILIKKNT